MHPHKKIGDRGEAQALNYLQQQGLLLVQTNFFSRFGEIDLIMRDDNEFVFVEVKHRKAGIDSALESITPAKQRKLVKTAEYFLLKLGHDVNCRFDAVVLDDNNHIEWLKNIIIL